MSTTEEIIKIENKLLFSREGDPFVKTTCSPLINFEITESHMKILTQDACVLDVTINSKNYDQSAFFG